MANSWSHPCCNRWIASWPELPALSGIQRTRIGADGQGVGEKLSLGASAGCLVVFGNPTLRECTMHVAEGVADAVATHAHTGGLSVAVLGTGGYQLDGPVARAIVAWATRPDTQREVITIADHDENGAGDKAADLRMVVTDAGGKARAKYPPGAKDMAAWAAQQPRLELHPPDTEPEPPPPDREYATDADHHHRRKGTATAKTRDTGLDRVVAIMRQAHALWESETGNGE